MAQQALAAVFDTNLGVYVDGRIADPLIFYADVICRRDAGQSIGQIVAETGVARDTVKKWIANWDDLCAGGEG